MFNFFSLHPEPITNSSNKRYKLNQSTEHKITTHAQLFTLHTQKPKQMHPSEINLHSAERSKHGTNHKNLIRIKTNNNPHSCIIIKQARLQNHPRKFLLSPKSTDTNIIKNTIKQIKIKEK